VLAGAVATCPAGVGCGPGGLRSWQQLLWREGEVPDGCRGKDQCGQATKGVWGMSRRQEAMKGVEDCEKPGEAVKQALIPGYPSERGELKSRIGSLQIEYLPSVVGR